MVEKLIAEGSGGPAPAPAPRQSRQGCRDSHGSRRGRAGTSSSSRMPISSTTRATIRSCSIPFSRARPMSVFGNRFHGALTASSTSGTTWPTGLLTLLTNMLTNLNLSDMEVGYKVFRADVVRRLAPHRRALRDRAGADHQGGADWACASTKSRSGITAARTPRGRRSRGATGSARRPHRPLSVLRLTDRPGAGMK